MKTWFWCVDIGDHFTARLTLRLVALQFFKTAYIPQLFAVQIEQGALRLGLVTDGKICIHGNLGKAVAYFP